MDAKDAQDFLELLAAEREITRVVLTYCRGSDQKDLKLMRQAYHDDAYDDHGPFKGGIDDYIAWIEKHLERFQQMMHHAGPPLIEIRGRVAVAETYCVLYQHLKPQEGERSGMTLTTGLRYVDRFEKRDGAWKIAYRTVVFHWVRKSWQSEQSAPTPMGQDFNVATRSPQDPVFTAWDLKKPASGATGL